MPSIEDIKAGIEAKGKQREKGVRKMWGDIRKLREEMSKGAKELRKGMKEKGKKIPKKK